MDLLRAFALLLGLQLLGETLDRLFAPSVPGPVAGLVLLLLGLLAWQPLARHVAPATDALLAHLSLLFVPAGVGVVVHLERLDGAVGGVVATLLGSTVIGLCVTSLVLQALLRRAGAVAVERGPGEQRTAEGERRG